VYQNYAWEDYVELKETIPGITAADLPVVNQIEINPFLYHFNMIAKFQVNGVILQSYYSLHNSKVFDNPVLQQLAAAYLKTPA